MFVTAEILGHNANNVVVIPRLVLRGKNRVLVVVDERLYYRTVDILRSDAETVIGRNGLKSGDQICISPLDTIVDGMRVRTVTEGALSEGAR